MADYFTNFSCELPVGSNESALAALALFERYSDELEEDEACAEFVATLEDCEPGVIWIHDGGSGNPEHVVEFVRLCAASLNLTGLWGFTWSRFCTRPVLGAFSGGAVVIDLARHKVIAEMGARQWLEEQLKRGGDNG